MPMRSRNLIAAAESEGIRVTPTKSIMGLTMLCRRDCGELSELAVVINHFRNISA